MPMGTRTAATQQQQQQQQQQRGYTELEVEQVRQVLAESGYPDPSHEDVELVLRHMRLYETGGEPHVHHIGSSDKLASTTPRDTSVVAASRATAAAAPPSLPSARSATVSSARHSAAHGSGSYSTTRRDGGINNNNNTAGRAAPSPMTWHVRSRRTAAHAWDAAMTPPAHSKRSASAHEQQQQQPVRRAQHATSGSNDDDVAGVTRTTAADAITRPHSAEAMTATTATQTQTQPQPPLLLRHSRRDANVLFDITGDSRYRFRPIVRATTAAAATMPRTMGGSMSSEVLVPPPQQQPHSGVYAARASERRRGQTLSRFAVSYLTADGSTLPRRADPVRRGEAMRALWQRDGFLMQRGRREAVWRTRQAMMHMLPCDDVAYA